MPNNTARYLVFDIETQNTFSQTGSRDVLSLDISLLVTWDSKTKEFKTYLENELHELWPVIEEVDILVGYNSDHFDIPLLNKYYPGDLTAIKSLDLMKEIYDVLGRRLRLDDVASATLKTKKSGSGLDAIRWWQEGKIDKIAKYCQKDVEITKLLMDYMLENNSVKYKDFGKVRELSLDTSDWLTKTDSSLTHTLGF